MKITSEIKLREFNFWSGAVNARNRFSYEELEQLECILEDIYYNETIEETTLNDLFWFDSETLCEWLEIDYNEWIERADNYYTESIMRATI